MILLQKRLDEFNTNNVSLNDTFSNQGPVNYSHQVLHTAPNQGYNSSNNSSFYSASNLTRNFKNGLANYNNNGNVVKKVMGSQSSSGSSALKKAQSTQNLTKSLAARNQEIIIKTNNSSQVQSSVSSRNRGFGLQEPKIFKSQQRIPSQPAQSIESKYEPVLEKPKQQDLR